MKSVPFKLNYVYKEFSGKDDPKCKTYKLELTKSQQNNLIANFNLPKELIQVSINQILIDISDLLIRLCLQIEKYWDRSIGLPLIMLKNIDKAPRGDTYKGVTIVPFYIDSKLDSVHQFLEWEDAITNISNFELMKVKNINERIVTRDHQSAVSIIRDQLRNFKQVTREVSKDENVPDTIIQHAMGEVFKATGLIPITNADVHAIYYKDYSRYKQIFQTLSAKYPGKTLFAFPYVSGKDVYQILFPVN